MCDMSRGNSEVISFDLWQARRRQGYIRSVSPIFPALLVLDQIIFINFPRPPRTDEASQTLKTW